MNNLKPQHKNNTVHKKNNFKGIFCIIASKKETTQHGSRLRGYNADVQWVLTYTYSYHSRAAIYSCTKRDCGVDARVVPFVNSNRVV